MTFWDNLLVIAILLTLAIIAYCRLMNKTLGEVIKEIREAMEEKEEII